MGVEPDQDDWKARAMTTAARGMTIIHSSRLGDSFKMAILRKFERKHYHTTGTEWVFGS
jgi:hypothetical protein